MVLIVMGVSGSGKSTVGAWVAQRLGWQFHDGDDFHPPANVAKMKQGLPLNDDDRLPWMQAIRQFMESSNVRGQNVVIACSALREKHRQLLRGDNDSWVKFAHLHGKKEMIASRMKDRAGHFMPVTLLESQFAALEPPHGVPLFDVTPAPGVIAMEVIQRLALDKE